MYDPFEFFGVTMEPGDVLILTPKDLPYPFEVAVVSYDADLEELEVMSTQLSTFHHDGRFKAEDITNIVVEARAETAVPLQARRALVRGQEVLVRTPAGEVHATVVAAIDGFVTGTAGDGQYISGGSVFWTPV